MFLRVATRHSTKIVTGRQKKKVHEIFCHQHKATTKVNICDMPFPLPTPLTVRGCGCLVTQQWHLVVIKGTEPRRQPGYINCVVPRRHAVNIKTFTHRLLSVALLVADARRRLMSGRYSSTEKEHTDIKKDSKQVKDSHFFLLNSKL